MIDLTDMLGKTYRAGGRGPEIFDCWGVVVEVGRRLGLGFPDWLGADFAPGAGHSRLLQIERTSGNWSRVYRNDLREGDVAVSRSSDSGARHAGVYLGRGYVIHTTPATGVLIETIDRFAEVNCRELTWARHV